MKDREKKNGPRKGGKEDEEGVGGRQSLGKSNQSKCNSLSFADECLGGFIYCTTILKIKAAGNVLNVQK